MVSAINADYPTSAPPPAVTDEQAVSGARLLASLEDWFRRHVVLPAGVPLVLSLWAINTYLFEVFDFCPYIALVSPVKRCGKTTVLKLLASVTRRPEFTVNISDAALFRSIEARRPTLLLDEAENLERGSLRAILNAGFEQAATVPRCVGQQVQDD
jgi:putative DNA primase/helicase